tara:strand:+ start:2405 stop:2659 length:255 start_codon:yes stop_codon:yes gene_type:complete
MKPYLITIETRDGDHEYWDRWIFECEEETTDVEILTNFAGGDKEDWTEVYSSWYESTNSYRHFQVRDRIEITQEDLKVLRRYGL